MQLQNGLTRSVPYFSQNMATTGRETAVKAKVTDGTRTPTFLITHKNFGDYDDRNQSAKDNNQQKNPSHGLTQSHTQGVARTGVIQPCQTRQSLHPPTDQHFTVKQRPHVSPSGFCDTSWQDKWWNTTPSWYFLSSPRSVRLPFQVDKESHITTFNLPKRASEENTILRNYGTLEFFLM